MASTLPFFTADDLRDRIGPAPSPGGSGAAFTNAARKGTIEPTGRYEKSTHPTNRGRVMQIWRSTTYGTEKNAGRESR